MKDHVVIAVIRRSNGRILVHAYGPYTKSTAHRERRLLSSSTPREYVISITANRVIDIDKMNQELETSGIVEDEDERQDSHDRG